MWKAASLGVMALHHISCNSGTRKYGAKFFKTAFLLQPLADTQCVEKQLMF